MEIHQNGYRIFGGVATVAITSYLAWIGVNIVAIKTKVDSTAIPSSTEVALNEIRTRFNADQSERVLLHELELSNGKDITYIKESILRIEGRLDENLKRK